MTDIDTENPVLGLSISTETIEHDYSSEENWHSHYNYTEEFTVVDYTLSKDKLESLGIDEERIKEVTSTKIRLLTIIEEFDLIHIHPVCTYPSRSNFLGSKYDQIETITLVGFEFKTPKTQYDVVELLECLPSGFIKNYEYGLGLQKDYRFIIHAIEEVNDIHQLVIFKNTELEQGIVFEQMFNISYENYELIRKGINRISNKHRHNAIIEKKVFSYNSLLSNNHPERYPERHLPYKKDTLYKLLSSASFKDSNLSNLDTKSLVGIINSNKKEIFSKNRNDIIDLRNDIDLLNIEWLINQINNLLEKNSSEDDWQNLLSNNPFILSLVFGYPVMKIKDQASVGGRAISGAGDKITDFLVKNNLTNNLALIEIKKSKTVILNKRVYRGRTNATSSVFVPSTELSGSISQLLDQKYILQKEIAMLKENSGI